MKLTNHSPGIQLQDQGAIVPWALYTAGEVGRLLRLSRKRVYELSPRELPRTRVGPNGGSVRFQGKDLLHFLEQRRDA